MKLVVVTYPGYLTVQLPPPDPAQGGGLFADFPPAELRPGERLWGIPYEMLAALGDGLHDVPVASAGDDGAGGE